MKKLSLFILAAGLAIVSCKKCSECVSEANSTYRWEDGDTLRVSDGSVLYKEKTYTEGETFTITYDTAYFANGLQFEGDGKVYIYSEVCGRGRTYKQELFEYDRSGWKCTEKK
jgi:hypothetical protein